MGNEWAQGTYWGTVAQVTPVLALALTIEARAVAARWAQTSKRRRWVEATVMAVLGFALASVFSSALGTLARAEDRPHWELLATSIALTISFAVLALNATILVATAGTLDLAMPVLERLRWLISPRLRKKVRALHVELLDTEREAASATAAGARVWEYVRGVAGRRKRLDPIEVSTFEDLIDPVNWDDEEHPLTTATRRRRSELRSHLDAYAQAPKRATAEAARRSAVHVAASIYALPRALHVRALRNVERLTLMLDSKGRLAGSTDPEELDALLLQASGPSLLPIFDMSRLAQQRRR